MAEKTARHYQRRITSILKDLYIDPAHLQEIREQLPDLKDQFEYLEDLRACAEHDAYEEWPDATIH